MSIKESAVKPSVSLDAGHALPSDHCEAVGRLFREHNRALVKFLLTRLPSEQEARDVAQEAYVRLLQLDQPGTISFLRGYLFRLAANLSIDRARSRKVRERAAVIMFEGFANDGALESNAMTTQELDFVCAALNELSEKHREAFFLRVAEGYSTPEVSRKMSVDERTVRKYVTRALVHCRQRLGAAGHRMESDW